MTSLAALPGGGRERIPDLVPELGHGLFGGAAADPSAAHGETECGQQRRRGNDVERAPSVGGQGGSAYEEAVVISVKEVAHIVQNDGRGTDRSREQQPVDILFQPSAHGVNSVRLGGSQIDADDDAHSMAMCCRQTMCELCLFLGGDADELDHQAVHSRNARHGIHLGDRCLGQDTAAAPRGESVGVGRRFDVRHDTVAASVLRAQLHWPTAPGDHPAPIANGEDLISAEVYSGFPRSPPGTMGSSRSRESLPTAAAHRPSALTASEVTSHGACPMSSVVGRPGKVAEVARIRPSAVARTTTSTSLAVACRAVGGPSGNGSALSSLQRSVPVLGRNGWYWRMPF